MLENKINKWLYYLIIILAVYQNCPLGKFYNFGRYPVWFFSIFVFCYLLITNKKLYLNKLLKVMLFLLVQLIFISMVSNFIYTLNTNEIILLKENIFIKSFSVIITFICMLITIIDVYNLTRNLEITKILKIFYYCYVFLFIYGLIELINIPYAFDFIPSVNKYPYYRIRLLTSESSSTSSIILIYGILSFLCSIVSKKRFNLLLTLIISVFFIIVNGSKTLYIQVIFLTVIYIIYNLKTKIKFRYLVILLISFILMVIFIFPKLLKSFTNDIALYTSTATRSYTVIVGIIVAIKYPFGTGGSLYLTILPQNLNKYIFLFDKVNIDFNLDEIYSLINATTDETLAIKSGLLQFGLYLGIIGILLFTYGYFNQLKKSKNQFQKLLNSLYIVIFISFLLATDFVPNIVVFIALMGVLPNKFHNYTRRQINL